MRDGYRRDATQVLHALRAANQHAIVTRPSGTSSVLIGIALFIHSFVRPLLRPIRPLARRSLVRGFVVRTAAIGVQVAARGTLSVTQFFPICLPCFYNERQHGQQQQQR